MLINIFITMNSNIDEKCKKSIFYYDATENVYLCYCILILRIESVIYLEVNIGCNKKYFWSNIYYGMILWTTWNKCLSLPVYWKRNNEFFSIRFWGSALFNLDHIYINESLYMHIQTYLFRGKIFIDVINIVHICKMPFFCCCFVDAAHTIPFLKVPLTTCVKLFFFIFNITYK